MKMFNQGDDIVNIDAIPILIENIGHMGKKSGLEEIPKVVDIIKENE